MSEPMEFPKVPPHPGIGEVKMMRMDQLIHPVISLSSANAAMNIQVDGDDQTGLVVLKGTDPVGEPSEVLLFFDGPAAVVDLIQECARLLFDPDHFSKIGQLFSEVAEHQREHGGEPAVYQAYQRYIDPSQLTEGSEGDD